jgi:hypothetical protein
VLAAVERYGVEGVGLVFNICGWFSPYFGSLARGVIVGGCGMSVGDRCGELFTVVMTNNEFHRSSSGCHVAMSNVAPETIVSNSVGVVRLTKWPNRSNDDICRCRSLSSHCHIAQHILTFPRCWSWPLWAVSHGRGCCCRGRCSSPGGRAVTNGGGGEEDGR